MKFSWKWLNDIINLKNINLNNAINQLVLTGFEIENIETLYVEPYNKDYLININITANREDIYSLVSITREISSVLNLGLPNEYQHIYTNKSYLSESKSKQIKYEFINDLYVDQITNIKNNQSPRWLINYLKAYNIHTKNLFSDISEYIKIKWGYVINIIDNSEIENNDFQKLTSEINFYNKNIDLKFIILDKTDIYSKKNRTYHQQHCQINYHNRKKIIVISSYYQINSSKNNKKSINRNNIYDFSKARREAITILTIHTKGIQSKSYQYQRPLNHGSIIEVTKIQINQVLGSLQKNKNYILTNQEILNSLKRLYFRPIYKNREKTFITNIPLARIQDIKRPIDIIEEIARIYGFKQFQDNLPTIKVKGKTSQKNKILKQIRDILRNLGLYEVINYSFVEKLSNNFSNYIEIYNPLIREQSILRQSLALNLIKKIKYSTDKNWSIAAFEIGEIFKYINLNKNKYIENTHLAGLLVSRNHQRNNWKDKPYTIGWFKAKGLIEDFFEKLNTKILWRPYNESNKINEFIYLPNAIDLKYTTIMYQKSSLKPIGFLARIRKYKHLKKLFTYIFEINLDTLIQEIYQPKNLSHRFTQYSLYPKVTRDICIQLKQHEYIQDVQNQIFSSRNPLIESVNIFNEYTTKEINKIRHVGLRITYRSCIKTLEENDINILNKEINTILQNYLTQ